MIHKLIYGKKWVPWPPEKSACNTHTPEGCNPRLGTIDINDKDKSVKIFCTLRQPWTSLEAMWANSFLWQSLATKGQQSSRPSCRASRPHGAPSAHEFCLIGTLHFSEARTEAFPDGWAPILINTCWWVCRERPGWIFCFKHQNVFVCSD